MIAFSKIVSGWNTIIHQDSFLRNTVLTLATNILLGGIVFITGPLIARMLGPEGRGVFATIHLWGFMFSLMASLGMFESIVYFVSKYHHDASDYLASSIFINLTFGIFVAILGWFLLPWILHNQSQTIVEVARLFLIARIIIVAIRDIPLQAMRGIGNWLVWNVLRVISPSLWLALVIWFWITEINMLPSTLAWIYIVAEVLSTLPILFIVRRHIIGSYKIQLSFIKPMAFYGLPLTFQVLPQHLNVNLDQLWIASLFDAHLLGIYVVAVAWSNLPTFIFLGIGAMVFPKISSITDPIVQKNKLFFIIKLTGFGTIVLTTAIFSVTPYMIPLLFGTDYQESISPSLVLVVASGFRGMNFIVTSGLRGLNKTKHVLFAEITGLVVTLVLLSILLKSLGIMGAALASLGAYSATFLYSFIVIQNGKAND